MLEPNIASFHDLSEREKRETVIAIISAAAEMWGEVCMPRADLGDNRLYDLSIISEWVQDEM